MSRLVAFNAPKNRTVWLDLDRVARIDQASGRKHVAHFNNVFLGSVELDEDPEALASKLEAPAAKPMRPPLGERLAQQGGGKS